jgi:tetratricopeptide (TPR) repeat protein
VVGRAFETATVMALTPERARHRVRETLTSLARRELVVPDREATAGGLEATADAYHFRHVLIRDAAYERLTKTERADLHERFAEWLEGIAGDRLPEYEAILGHHLERAWQYRTEMRDSSEGTRAVGLRAARHLQSSGKRARERGEVTVAEGLLLRAEGLPSANEESRAELLVDTGRAQLESGRAAVALERAGLALELASRSGDGAIAARARLLRYDASIAMGTLADTDPAALAEIETALHDATVSGDSGALALAWSARGMIAYMSGQLAESAEHNRVALMHARVAGDVRLALDLEVALLGEAFVGSMPATEVVELGRSLLARAQVWPYVRADVLRLLAPAEAMLGRHDDAVAHALESVAILRDLAQLGAVATAESDLGGWVYRLGGDLPAAEIALRRAYAAAEAIGDRNQGAYVACRVAQLLVARGRFAEALPWLEEAETYHAVTNESRVVGARARIRAASGDPGATDEVARLLAIVAETRFVNIRTDALVDAAEAMAALGRIDDALGYAREALVLADAKENRVLAGQIATLIASLAT